LERTFFANNRSLGDIASQTKWWEHYSGWYTQEYSAQPQIRTIPYVPSCKIRWLGHKVFVQPCKKTVHRASQDKIPSCKIKWLGHKVSVQPCKKNWTPSFSRYNSSAQPQPLPVRGNILQDQTMQVGVKCRNPLPTTKASLWAQATWQKQIKGHLQHHVAASNPATCTEPRQGRRPLHTKTGVHSITVALPLVVVGRSHQYKGHLLRV